MYSRYRGKKGLATWCVAGLFAASTAYFGIRDYMRHLGVVERHDKAVASAESLVDRAKRNYELSKVKSERILIESKNEYNSRLKKFDRALKSWEEHYHACYKSLIKFEAVAERAGLVAEIREIWGIEAKMDDYRIALDNARKTVDSELGKK